MAGHATAAPARRTNHAPRTYTTHAKVKIKVAADFLAWLAANDTEPASPQAARRATLTDLASQLPAAVLADLLNLSPSTAVR